MAMPIETRYDDVMGIIGNINRFFCTDLSEFNDGLNLTKLSFRCEYCDSRLGNWILLTNAA